MNRATRRGVLAAGASLSLSGCLDILDDEELPLPGGGEDTPPLRYESYGYHAGNRGYHPEASPPPGDPHVVWRFDDLPPGDVPQTPAVVGDAVYLVGRDSRGRSLYALDREEGGPLWSTPISGRPAPTPAVDGDTIYVATRGVITAIDRESGDQNWEFPGVNDPGPPVVADDVVVVGDREGGLVAFDAEDSGIRWAADAAAATASPAYRDGAVHYVDSGGERLVAADPGDGSESWTLDLPAVSPLCGITVAGSDVYVAGSDGVVAVDTAAGENGDEREVAWTAGGAVPRGLPPTVDDGAVYVVDGNELVALSREDGSQRWRTGGDPPGTPTLPTVVEGVLHADLGDGHLSALRTGDGSTRGQIGEKGTGYYTPVFLDGDGVVCTEEGDVVALGQGEMNR